MTERQIIKRQLLRFLVVGCTAVVIDLIVYTLLITVIPIPVAKTLSFLAGTVFAYFTNKLWTFDKPGRNHVEMFSFFLLYGTTLLVNVGVNQLTLYLFPGALGFAFLAATGTSTILNFIGQKWWVFRSRTTSE